MTLAEHCRLFEAAHGQPVSRDTMRRAIDRLGWTWKKIGGGRRTKRI